ncbi:hypothetical protein CYLTODRAFT_413147 [Cylindrobasidium torrendii FP15055 ss-10]|uniref:Uncharacterized protein n=1 Tax=Cylindrobasidium torrendii FP15055 ss-10 TaxID=1314674 RepID=A0A0D7B289_9AGAR|nr:hypothetical protein CYLTODRAFT_413147 [Cylindrobasidium torrendii FP15055 ss-10]
MSDNFEFPDPPMLDVVLSDALKTALAEGANLNSFAHYDPFCRHPPTCRARQDAHYPRTPPSSVDPSVAFGTNNDDNPPPLEGESTWVPPVAQLEQPPCPWISTSHPDNGESVERIWSYMRTAQLGKEKEMEIHQDKDAAKDVEDDPQSGWSLFTQPQASCMTAVMMPFKAAFARVSGLFERDAAQNNYTFIYPIKIFLGSEFDSVENM